MNNKLLAICLYFEIVSSAKLVEYRLGINYGQVLTDYTSYHRHAVNGKSYLSTDNDTAPMDRGAVFRSTFLSIITMPSNDWVNSSFLLPSTFTINTWMLTKIDGYIFSRYINTSNYLYISIKNTNLKIEIKVNGTSYEFSSTDSSLTSDTWFYISLTVQNNLVTGYLNSINKGSVSLAYNYAESGNYNTVLGGYSSNSFNGVVWYFVVDDNLTYNSYIWPNGNKCLVNGCNGPNSCTPAIVDLVTETWGGCINVGMDGLKDANLNQCPSNCSNGCNTTSCLNCTSCSYSCFMTGYDPTICSGGTYLSCGLCYNCYSDCSTCNQSSKCLSCKAANALVDINIGCYCPTGYYNSSNLGIGSCIACYNECLTCKAAFICASCKASNAVPDARRGCKCSPGYYNITDLSLSNSCLPCYSDCATCTNSLECVTCKSANSYASPKIGCICSTGYYNTTSLATAWSCIQCHSDCLACNQSNICLACLDPNAYPDETKGCKCKSQFYRNTYALSSQNLCNSCHKDCYSCNNNATCTVCMDSNALPSRASGCDCKPGFYYDSTRVCQACNLNCARCSNDTSCIECSGPNTIINDSDFCDCEEGYFIASRLPTVCNPCGNLCKTCPSSSDCSECAENALLNNLKCSCKPGYSHTASKCTINYFHVSLSITPSNSITLSFEVFLSSPLEKSNLTLVLENTELEFDIEEIDASTYTIVPSYLTDISANAKLEIYLEPLLSLNNSLLFNTFLTVVLFQTSYLSSQQHLESQINTAKNLGTQGAAIGSAIVLGLGALNLNVGSLFNFINTAEIYYSIVLINSDLDPVLSNFLISTRMQSKIPNVFKYIITEKKGVGMIGRYTQYGYGTNIFILNSQAHIIAFISLLALSLFLFFLNKSLRFKKILIPVLNMVRFGVFLRYWVQTFYDICLSSSLGIKYTNFENWVQVLDFVLCIIILVRFNQLLELGVIIKISLVAVKGLKITGEDEIKVFINRYPTFFEEFKDRKLSGWSFYMFFILRRVIIVICINLISLPIIQIFINFCMSMTVISNQIAFYILVIRPFKEPLYNIFHFINELIIGTFQLTLFVKFLPQTSVNQSNITNICIGLVTASWLLNIVVSTLSLLKTAVEKFAAYFKKKKVYHSDKVEEINVEDTDNNIIYTKQEEI